MKSLIRGHARFVGALLMALTCLGAAARSATPDNTISVKKFSEDSNDQSAVIDKVPDRATGKPCALILITNENNLEGFKFNTGTHFSKVENYTDNKGRHVVKLWVSPNVKRMTISHEHKDIKPMRNFDFNGKSLKEATVYHMELGYVNLPSAMDRQFVEFTVTPPDGAYLEVNGEPWALNENGYASKPLPFGNYRFLVTAPDRREEAGKFVLNTISESKVINVVLRPDYGYLTLVGDDMRDADIYIDQQRYSYSQLNRLKVKSGRHTLKIVRKNYSPYQQTFDIFDDKEERISPRLDANYSTVTIYAPKGCNITIDGENKGLDTWSGPLEPGTYTIEARKAGHKPFRKTYEVSKINEQITITLLEPEPIYGSVDISSDPRGASISIDGKPIGHLTPFSQRLLIGTHTISLSKPGYQPYETSVTINPEGVENVSAKLSNTVNLVVSWTPSNATLSVDGSVVSSHSPYTMTCLPKTEHNLKLEYSGYHDLYKTVTVDKNKTESLSMKRIVYHKYYDWGHIDGDSWESNRYFFMGAEGGYGNLTTVGGNFGFVYRKLFMLLDAGYCLNDEQEVYAYPKDEFQENRQHLYITPGLYFGGRLGLAFQCGRVMFNPQIGYRHMDLEGSWVGSGLAALRMQIRFSSHFAFILSPEYYTAVMQGDGFKYAAKNIDEVKKLGTGYRVAAGFEVYF